MYQIIRKDHLIQWNSPSHLYQVAMRVTWGWVCTPLSRLYSYESDLGLSLVGVAKHEWEYNTPTQPHQARLQCWLMVSREVEVSRFQLIRLRTLTWWNGGHIHGVEYFCLSLSVVLPVLFFFPGFLFSSYIYGFIVPLKWGRWIFCVRDGVEASVFT